MTVDHSRSRRNRLAVSVLFVVCLFGGEPAWSGRFPGRPSPIKCREQFRELLAGVRPTVREHTKLDIIDQESNIVRWLGTGIGGGDVFRVQPIAIGSTPYAVKVYRLGGAAVLEHDLLAIKAIDQALRKLGTKNLRTINVLDRLNPETLKLEYVGGVSLKELYLSASHQQQLSLRRLYLRQLKTMSRALRKMQIYVAPDGQTYRVHRFGGSLEYRDDPNTMPILRISFSNTDPSGVPENIHIMIHPGNMLRTPDGHFVIIDPS